MSNNNHYPKLERQRKGMLLTGTRGLGSPQKRLGPVWASLVGTGTIMEI